MRILISTYRALKNMLNKLQTDDCPAARLNWAKSTGYNPIQTAEKSLRHLRCTFFLLLLMAICVVLGVVLDYNKTLQDNLGVILALASLVVFLAITIYAVNYATTNPNVHGALSFWEAYRIVNDAILKEHNIKSMRPDELRALGDYIVRRAKNFLYPTYPLAWSIEQVRLILNFGNYLETHLDQMTVDQATFRAACLLCGADCSSVAFHEVSIQWQSTSGATPQVLPKKA